MRAVLQFEQPTMEQPFGSRTTQTTRCCIVCGSRFDAYWAKVCSPQCQAERCAEIRKTKKALARQRRVRLRVLLILRALMQGRNLPHSDLEWINRCMNTDSIAAAYSYAQCVKRLRALKPGNSFGVQKHIRSLRSEIYKVLVLDERS